MLQKVQPALKQVAWGCSGVSIIADTQKPSGWCWATNLRWPCLSKGFGQMTFRGHFQPQALCDSALTLNLLSFLLSSLTMNIPLNFPEKFLDKILAMQHKFTLWLLFYALLLPLSRRLPKPTDIMKNVGHSNS